MEDLRKVGCTDDEEEEEEDSPEDITVVLLKVSHTFFCWKLPVVKLIMQNHPHACTPPQDTHALSKMVKAWKAHQSWDDQVEWTTEDRIRKIAQDLFETEREYVRVSAYMIIIK